jgi:hypothetical protein
MNNKQAPNNQIIPITDYLPKDIKNVSKKVILNPKNHERCNPPFIAHPYKKSPT